MGLYRVTWGISGVFSILYAYMVCFLGLMHCIGYIGVI